jgi:two-component system, OmpR family, sensor histidine kinase TctE
MKSPSSERARSIRRRLFGLLLIPSVLVLAAGTLSDYFTAVTPFREAYDQSLIDGALAVAANVRMDANNKAILTLPPEAVAILRADSSDSIYYRVSDSTGALIGGDANLPEAPRSGTNPSRADATFLDEPIRVVSYRTYTNAGMLTISVAETTHKRDGVRTRILSSSLAVDFMELGLVLALIGVGARLALSPLREVQEQIAQRSARDLAPLPLDRVPVEIRSIVDTLNRLFNTVSESASAQRRFLESAAHQLRTPLTGIQAQLELMAADEADSSKQQRLWLILDAARRLTHTTQQLLTLARSDEAANLRWDLVDVSLPLIVENIVADRVAAADRAGIDLGAEIYPACVRGVGWLLNEAVGNLANNAIAHSPAGAQVTIRCGVQRGQPFVEVTDSGVGIPPEERDRVLERFVRGSNARGNGSGLGLAIVREVAQMHGATIDIDTGPSGKGTSVTLRFPMLSTSQRPAYAGVASVSFADAQRF